MNEYNQVNETTTIESRYSKEEISNTKGKQIVTPVRVQWESKDSSLESGVDGNDMLSSSSGEVVKSTYGSRPNNVSAAMRKSIMNKM